MKSDLTAGAPPLQFWLSRVQVINWGVFHGYHDVAVSRKGTLITGASGAGKSSLLDAISVGFLSNKRRNFNASGDRSSGNGAAGNQRNVDRYVRGLVGDVQLEGERTTQKYLRPTVPVWSAIALTYTGSDGSVVTGMVLKTLAAGQDTGANGLYAIIAKDVDIKAPCDEWAVNGYTRATLEKTGWQCRREESWYLETLYGHIGLTGADAALDLLGKAKSLKSVGNLETFVREYMLDEPESLRELHIALERIDPLIQARDALSVASKKLNCLKDIEATHQNYLTEREQLARIGMLEQPDVAAWVDHQRQEKIPAAIDSLDATIRVIAAEIESIDDRRRTVDSERRAVLNTISSISGNLAPLRAAVEEASSRSQAAERGRSEYDNTAWALDLPPADTVEGFLARRGESIAAEADITARIGTLKREPMLAALTALTQARDQQKKAAAELHRVEQIGSSVPDNEEGMRESVIRALGLNRGDLPYVCELVDLRSDRSLWRKAVEKTLRTTGLVLLVPERYERAVRCYVNDHNMGGLLRLEKVSVGAPAAEPAPGTLGSCLELIDPGHECARAAQRLIAEQGDYVLVDGPGEFDNYRRAVTVEGLRKESDRRSVKDDRKELRASQYIFQGNIVEKIAALRDELTEAQEKLQAAEAGLALIENDISELEKTRDLWRALARFDSFAAIDVAGARADQERLQRQLDAVMAEHPDLEVLEAEAANYKDEYDKLGDQRGRLIAKSDEHQTRGDQLRSLLENLNPAPVDETQQAAIASYLHKLSHPLDLLEAGSYVRELWRVISDEQNRRAESVRRHHKRLEDIIDNFDDRFPESPPNNSSDLDEKVVDYVALWRRLETRDVKEAEKRMEHLITDQAPNAILRLHHLATDEARRIGDQINQVNAGLASVEYAPGTILKLCADDKNLAAVRQFRDIARRISDRITAVSNRDKKAMFEQFEDILELRNRLASDQLEDRRWRAEALDVRNWFSFYCAEHHKDDPVNAKAIYRNAHSKSGGEQEKLMAFCLAGALSYNLANHDSGDNRPVFSQLMIDEAFSKSDPNFARQSLAAFRRFGFQLLIVATVQNTTVIQPFIEKVVMVGKNDADLASAQSVTLQRLSELRREAVASAAAGELVA